MVLHVMVLNGQRRAVMKKQLEAEFVVAQQECSLIFPTLTLATVDATHKTWLSIALLAAGENAKELLTHHAHDLAGFRRRVDTHLLTTTKCGAEYHIRHRRFGDETLAILYDSKASTPTPNVGRPIPQRATGPVDLGI